MTLLRLRALTASCRAILAYRASRWPPSVQTTRRVNTLQTRMYATMLRSRRIPVEDAAAYVRRLGHEAAALARAEGTWGERHRERTVSWLRPLQRRPAGPSWVAVLLRWQDHEWLRRRRMMFGSTALAGRTQTRATPGPGQRGGRRQLCEWWRRMQRGSGEGLLRLSEAGIA